MFDWSEKGLVRRCGGGSWGWEFELWSRPVKGLLTVFSSTRWKMVWNFAHRGAVRWCLRTKRWKEKCYFLFSVLEGSVGFFWYCFFKKPKIFSQLLIVSSAVKILIVCTSAKVAFCVISIIQWAAYFYFFF